MAHALQAQRYELKYVIPEDAALQVRDYVRAYLEIDEFGATMSGFSYPVHSLYLDSDDLYLYRTTINGDKNRFKLRLRYYEDRPDAPVFFEVKRRMNSIIMKQRGGVKREHVADLLAGHFPDPSFLLSKDPKHLNAVQNFCTLMLRIGARPKAHIGYMREAWISPQDNSVRVTLDRDVQCHPEPTPRLSTAPGTPVTTFGKNVILELKFTNRYPNWVGDLVRTFGTMQCGAAKYADGVAVLGERAIRQAFAFDGPSRVPTVSAPVEGNGTENATQSGAGVSLK
jgi:SPX domain protein involved in polyphosphate accumulation